VGAAPARQRAAHCRPAAPDGPLAFDALVNGPGGLALAARRTAAPWSLTGARIDAVRVTGTGRVVGLRWIGRSRVAGIEPRPWRTWSLPLGGSTPRYRPTAAAPAEADARVSAGAAVRRPLYAATAYAVPAPKDAPPQPLADVTGRVATARPELLGWLQELMTKTSTPMRDVRRTYLDAPPAPPNGKAPEPTSIGLGLEAQLLTSAVDPDLARWLGFGDVDPNPGVPSGSLVVYHVRGLWRIDLARWLEDLYALPVDYHLRLSRAEALAAFPELAAQNIAPDGDGPVPRRLGARRGGRRRAAGAAGGPADRGHRGPGLAARRGAAGAAGRARARARARRAGAGRVHREGRARAASAQPARRRRRHQPPGEPAAPPQPLAVSRPRVDGESGRGWLDDRDAEGIAVEYRLAQSDWFGRWSGWGTATAGPKLRTPPMAPTIEGHYAAPTEFPNMAADRGGTLTLRVPVPRLDDLPPGGYPLDALEVTRTVDGVAGPPTHHLLSNPAATGATLSPPDPATGKQDLVIAMTDVLVPRAGQRQVQIVARWRDTAAPTKRYSAPSVAFTRTLRDPRPPVLPQLPSTLRFSARPDAMGRARVELSWDAQPGTRYRVFASTDATLVQALREGGHLDAADAIAATADLSARASALQAQAQHLGWEAFQHLTTDAVEGSGGKARYVHHLSGGLAGLACYRVLPQAASGAMPDIATAPLIPVAVPNLGPPPQPLASLVHGADAQGAPLPPSLDVVVLPSRATPAAWRLRRASVGGAPAARMLVVGSGAVAAAPATDGTTRFTVTDTATLRPWRRYHYAVEVQAPPSVGQTQTLAGEWSAASAPVPYLHVPPGPPAAPTSVVAAVDGATVRLTIAHPDPNLLVPTALGRFAVEIVRAPEGGAGVRRSLPVTREPDGTYRAVDDVALAAGVKTTWAVRVLDPLGRAGAATASNTL
jgi:hypothetical protein